MKMIQSWLYAMLGDQDRARLYEPMIRDFVQQYESFKPLYFVNRAQNEYYAGDFEKALETFEGIKRRQEVRGTVNGVTVMDEREPIADRECGLEVVGHDHEGHAPLLVELQKQVRQLQGR